MAEGTDRRRPLIFLVVGIGNALFDFAIYTLITLTVFRSVEMLALAGIVSGTIALLFAFFMHRFVTWRDRHVDKFAIVRFFIVTGFGMWVLRPLLLVLFGSFEQFYRSIQELLVPMVPALTVDFIRNSIAFVGMSAVVLVYNFLTYERFVFPKKKAA